MGGRFSRSDRQHVLQELERTRAALLGELEGLSDRQASFQPTENKWAVIHALEHIIRAEEVLRGLVENLLKGEPAPDGGEAVSVSDAEVSSFVVDRTRKFEAPKRVQPTGRYATLQEAVDDFKATRRRSVEFVKGIDRDLRAYRATNPVLGELDGYQWLLFLSGHSERHTLQIKEIKAAENFPGK